MIDKKENKKLKEQVKEYEKSKNVFMHSLAFAVTVYAGLALSVLDII